MPARVPIQQKRFCFFLFSHAHFTMVPCSRFLLTILFFLAGVTNKKKNQVIMVESLTTAKMAELSVSTTATAPAAPSKENQGKNYVASDREYGGKDDSLTYKSGIPTLRSSAHRVKIKKQCRNHDPKPMDRYGNETKTTWLPSDMLVEDILQYDETEHDLKGAILSLLLNCDPDIVGTFEQQQQQQKGEGEEKVVEESTTIRLEDFRVPIQSTWRKVNGGCCEASQKYLSDQIASNEKFLQVFDKFVLEVALPYFKRRLLQASSSKSVEGDDDDSPITFYYQRPPTLRLQPGPGWAKVKPHNDAEYGHQNGELNFWIPLTDRSLTGVDLWSESSFERDDYHPIPAKVGQAVSFHGSSCRHYVNANSSNNTRVSLDFRVGAQGFFDPYWQMRGTTDDHGRQEVTL